MAYSFDNYRKVFSGNVINNTIPHGYGKLEEYHDQMYCMCMSYNSTTHVCNHIDETFE